MTRPSQSQVAKVRREPEVHVCVQCGKPNAPCGIGDVWHCPEHAPADYWPASEERGA